MTYKIKENAIKIAELKNEIPKKVPHTKWYRIGEYLVADVTTNTAIYESYNGLMPIVFECNTNTNMNTEIRILQDSIMFVYLYQLHVANDYFTEIEFILALQECIIKYLEVKNG